MVLRCMVQHLPCHQSIDRICTQMGCTMATSHDWNLDITQQDSWLGVQALWLSHTKWWLSHPPEKYESQIGSSSQLLGKIKFMFQTTNQICSVYPCWWSHKHRPQTTADLHQRWALQTTASPKKNNRNSNIQRSQTPSLRSPCWCSPVLRCHRGRPLCPRSPNAFESTLPTKLGVGHEPQRNDAEAPTRVDLNFFTADETVRRFPKSWRYPLVN